VTTCEDTFIERAACRDQEAFRHLWEAQRALAEDITQGAFLLAWRGLPRFKKGCPFRPWLMRILYRHALDVMEKQGTYLRPLSLDEVLASAAPMSPERPVLGRKIYQGQTTATGTSSKKSMGS